MRGERGARLFPGALLALLLLVPLAPNAGLFTNADLPKRALLIAGVLALLLVVLVRALRSKEETKVPVPENLSLLSVAVVAGFLVAPRAPDARLTFLALATLGALAAAGLLAARRLADDRGVRRVAATFLAAAAVAALLGILGWPAGRASVFGNPSFAAEFVAGALPLALFFLVRPGRALRIALAATVVGLVFLVLAKSRADWLGAILGVLVALLLIDLARRGRRPAPALSAAVLLAAILALPFAIDALPLPLFGRSDTVRIRGHIREATLEMALDHPAAGVGLGGFRAAYPAYRHPEEARLSLGREVTFPHHLPLLVFAETGALGLLALLAFLWSALYAGIRTALSRPGDAFAPAATGAVVAVLVSSQFSAPLLHPGSALLFFVLVGLLTARRPGRYVTRLSGRYRRAVPVLVLLAPLAVGAVLLPSRLGADLHYREATDLEAESGGAMDEHVARLLERSVAAAPLPEAYRQLAFWLTGSGRPEEALARLDRLLALYPHDARGLAERGKALLALGRTEDGRTLLEDLLARRPDDENVKFLTALARIGTGEPGVSLPLLYEAMKEMPLETVRGSARAVAGVLRAESWDGFTATVSTWPDAARALAILSVFGDGYGDFYRAVVLTREGRHDEAMDALRRAQGTRALDGRDPAIDPRFLPLRSRADFRALFPG